MYESTHSRQLIQYAIRQASIVAQAKRNNDYRYEAERCLHQALYKEFDWEAYADAETLQCYYYNVKTNECFEYYIVTSKGEVLVMETINVNVLAREWGIDQSDIIIDGNKITVRGYLKLRGCTGLTTLPENLTVGGALYLRGCTGLTTLPENLTVGGALKLRGCTGLTTLPENLTVGRTLDLRGCTGLTTLPENLTVGRTLYLDGCTGLTTLPENLTVGGYLDLDGCTGLTTLPENLTVGGALDLRGCTGLTTLPENLTVGGYLDLAGCTGLTTLPENLTVGGALYLDGTQLAFPKKISKPKQSLAIDLKFLIESRFNTLGYTITDGVLAKILSTKKNIKKVRVVGELKDSYLVTDGRGNYAHGETARKAREDLIYKAVTKFEGKLPQEARGEEWVGLYRAVTGACAQGVKLFVEQSGKSLKKTYTAEEVAEMIKGRYGEDKFIEKLKECR